MAELKIERATPDELDDLCELNAEVQKLHAAAEGDYFSETSDPALVKAFFANVLIKEANYLYLARHDNKAVAYLWCEIIERGSIFSQARRCLHIHHIAVTQPMQGQAIGGQLLSKVDEIAREQGISYIDLFSWAFNTQAQSFFAAQGFRPLSVQMGKKIE